MKHRYTLKHAAPSPRTQTISSLALAVVLTSTGLLPAQATEEPAPAPAQQVQETAGPEFYTQQESPEALIAPSFYEIPAQLPAANGAVIKHEPIQFWKDPNFVIRGNAATTQRIMYKSTNFKGEPVAVTGTAFTSKAKWRGPGERPVVVVAPGTQGVGDACAPSNQIQVGTEYESLAISPLLDAGYNVVMTDYVGSGTEGTHSYLNRVDQGNAVLDAARAASDPALGLGSAQVPVGIWGYSQGGGAAASAGELQPTYAPELNLKGIYAGAIPADLNAVTNKIDGTVYNGFMLMGLVGLGDSYGVDYSQYINDAGMKTIEKARDMCTTDAIGAFGSVRNTGAWTKSGQKISQLMQADSTFAEITRENNLGEQGRAPQAPILIASSWGDDVIPHRANRQLAKKYCEAGANVSFYMGSTPTHAMSMLTMMPRALIFMDHQFKGLPNSQDCWQVGG